METYSKLKSNILNIKNLPLENITEFEYDVNDNVSSEYSIKFEKKVEANDTNNITDSKQIIDNSVVVNNALSKSYTSFQILNNTINFNYYVIIFLINNEYYSLNKNDVKHIIVNFIVNNKATVVDDYFTKGSKISNKISLKLGDNNDYYIILVEGKYLKNVIDFKNFKFIYKSENKLNSIIDALALFPKLFLLELYSCTKEINYKDYLVSNKLYDISEGNDKYYFMKYFYNKTNYITNINKEKDSSNKEYNILVIRPYLVKFKVYNIIKDILKANNIIILQEIKEYLSDYKTLFLSKKENIKEEFISNYRNIMRSGECCILFLYGSNIDNIINCVFNGGIYLNKYFQSISFFKR